MRYQLYTGQEGITYARIDGPISGTGLGSMTPVMTRTDRHEPSRREYGTLLVTCYCEEELVRVNELDICHGKTGTCGRPGCEPEEVR